MTRSAVGRTPTRSVADALLAFWCVFWVAAGVLTGQAVWQLGDLTGTLERSGEALDDAGEALQSLGGLPVVGDPTAALGDEVRTRAADVVGGARQTRGDVQRLAFLLGGAVAVLPTVPLLAVALPGRLRAERDARDVRHAVATEPPASVDAYLASRALANLPLSTLRRYTPDPLGAAARGKHDGLANAELARLGLRRTGPPEPTAPARPGS